jgi:hypothetical protein
VEASTRKKRAGVFRSAVSRRSSFIQAMRDVGLSWSEVARHFASDVALGNASAEHFSSEWSRLGRQGRLNINERIRCKLRDELLLRLHEGGLSGWGVSTETDDD